MVKKKKKVAKKGKKGKIKKLPSYVVAIDDKNRLRVSISQFKDTRSGEMRSYLDIRMDFQTTGTTYKRPQGVENDPTFAGGWSPTKKGMTIHNPEVVDGLCDVFAEKGERLVSALKKLKNGG